MAAPKRYPAFLKNLSPQTLRRIMFAAIILGAFGGVGLLIRTGSAVVDAFFGSRVDESAVTAETIAVRTMSVVDAAQAALGRPSRLVRPPAEDGPGGYQVTLDDFSGYCWKVAVRTGNGSAAPAGQPAYVGCPRIPAAPTGPAGPGDIDAAVETATRNFLDAYLSGGDVTRWLQPGVPLAIPVPLPKGSFSFDSVEQSGPADDCTVTVDGWVEVAGSKTDVTYRLDVVGSDVGPVVAFVAAGPLAPTETTVPPTTVPPTTTTTTAPTTTTTRKGAE